VVLCRIANEFDTFQNCGYLRIAELDLKIRTVPQYRKSQLFCDCLFVALSIFHYYIRKNISVNFSHFGYMAKPTFLPDRQSGFTIWLKKIEKTQFFYSYI
jgi:hypothetical protein